MNTLMNFVMGGALLVMVAVIYLPLDHYLLSDPADRRGASKGTFHGGGTGLSPSAALGVRSANRTR